MKGIVILGSSVTALGVLREAHDLGLSCVLFDTRAGIAMSSRYGKRLHFRDDNDQLAILSQLTGLGEKDRALIATEDRWLQFIVAQRPALDKAYGVILAPSNEVLSTCLNKGAFASWCLQSGLPAPRSWSFDCLADAKLPAFIRPVSTLHDRPQVGLPKAVRVDSLYHLNEWADRFRRSGVEALISESLLDRRVVQYSIPFARRGGEIVSFVARKVRPPASWARTGTYVELCSNAEVEQLARTALEALDYFGIGEVEILQSEDDGRCYLIEINARPWLQYTLATASGHGLLRFLLGIAPAAQAKLPRKDGVRWMNFRADLYVCFSRSEGLVPHGKLRLSEYLVSLLRTNAFANFDWRDPGPVMKEFAALMSELTRDRSPHRWESGAEKRP